ncbi:MAG: 1-acyl-sn-glycerol-3-phosphate acyltransferase [Deltaproteobacteria bacterium]|nr:1-acyl-sn-glycerol-3-phosphate acyltransferase [Deltaproteobacteria bacterium]
MSPSEKYPLSFQYYVGWVSAFILAPIVYLLILLAGYRIRNVRQVRQYCRANFKTHKGPWIICANHLTMIDSVFLIYTMAPFYDYLFNYRILPWNLPERANFKKNTLLTILTYLTKCIPISRGSSRTETKAVLEKCIYLMKENQPVLIFPEGGRSRIGKVDVENFSYGVGYFIQNCKQAKVMCLYLRGDRQDSYSNYPRWGEHFTAIAEVLEPQHSELTGLRAQRAYAGQIIQRLAKMEESYFSLPEQKHRLYHQSKGLKKDAPSALIQPHAHLR